MEKKDFDEFAAEIVDKEAERKAINDEIKVAKENFAEKHNVTKKTINKLMKAYKEWVKNQAEFTLVDREVSEIADKVFVITAATQATESE